MSEARYPNRDEPGVTPPQTEDQTRVDDVRIGAVRPLISPAMLMEDLPLSARDETRVAKARAAVAEVLDGHDERLLVVIGPCSIHDRGDALEYASRLAKLATSLQEDLLVVMRVYFEKPRTTVGWKGLINDPRLDGSYRMNEGLRLARQLLLDIVDMGLPTGTEFLDLLSPQYIADLVSWGAIGARTTESQTHRQLASGLSCPVGFKNGTDGGIKVAADAIVSARSPHAFMGMTKMGQGAIFETRGNPACHVILRGGREPNYDAASVDLTCATLGSAGLAQRVMIDCSHANAAKQHDRQLAVAADIAARLAAGDTRIRGLMIESHLHAGRQDFSPGAPLRPGVSITDACIGWDDSAQLLHDLAAAARQRRANQPPR